MLKTKPPRTHLGFTAQLKFCQFSGRFLQNSSEICEAPLQYFAGQLNVPAFDIETYDFASRSGKRHRSEIIINVLAVKVYGGSSNIRLKSDALLGIFFYFRQREIIGGLIELFIQIVHRLTVRAERKLIKGLLSDFQKVHGKTNLLSRIVETALLNPEGRVKDVVYPVAGENVRQNLLQEFDSSGPGYKQQVDKIIRSFYGNHYRRMVPRILEALTFCSGNTQHRPMLEALEWIQ